MNFSPSTAIVTASDSGIGRVTAVALAQNGMDIGVTWHTDAEGAEQTANEVRALGRKGGGQPTGHDRDTGLRRRHR